MLKVEIKRIFTQRSFLLYFILYSFMYSAILYGSYSFLKEKKEIGDLLFGGDLYIYPFTWNTITYWGRIPVLALCLFVIGWIAQDFENGAYKRYISFGISRNKIFWGKIQFILILSILPALIALISVCWFEYIGNGGIIPKQLMHKSYYLLIFYWQNFYILCFTAMFAFFIKKPYKALMLFLGYYLIVENVIRYIILKANLVNGISDFLPNRIAWSLVKTPFTSEITKRMINENQTDFFVPKICLSVLFCGIILLLSLRNFNKSDL